MPKSNVLKTECMFNDISIKLTQYPKPDPWNAPPSHYVIVITTCGQNSLHYIMLPQIHFGFWQSYRDVNVKDLLARDISPDPNWPAVHLTESSLNGQSYIMDVINTKYIRDCNWICSNSQFKQETWYNKAPDI